MNYPVKDFKDKWYDAQPYGSKTSYGWHDGADLNLKTGGNSDLGYGIYAIAGGVVTSVQNLTTGFGFHIHIQHDGPWGTVYSHYAHCSVINVKIGDSVKEGDRIANVGSTGNSKYAHLHFSIKLEPTGVNAVPHNLTELKKWTDPIPFIEKWMNVQAAPPSDLKYTEEEMSDMRDQRDKNYNDGQEWKSQYEKQKTIAEETKKELNQFLEDLAVPLSPVVVDTKNILAEVKELSNVEERLRVSEKNVVQQEKKFALKESELLEKIDNLTTSVDKQQAENVTILGQLTALKEEVKQRQEERETISRFGAMIKELLSKFGK